MEYSKFNQLAQIPGTTDYVLYNFLSGSMMKLDVESKALLDCITTTEGHEEEKALLVKNGFLCDGLQEIDYMRLGNIRACTDSDILSVLIATTMRCNFACPYCFEACHDSPVMDEETQDAIVRFVEESLKKNHHKQLYIYWFGGEPLLGIRVIQRMAPKLIALAHQYGARYTSGMSTNGYFLTAEAVKILEACQLGSLQITLDGLKERNDRTRILRSGAGTFDVIMENLRNLHTSIRIRIRSNVHRDNWADYLELKQLVEEIAEKNDLDLAAYAAKMSMYEQSDRSMAPLAFSDQEYADLLAESRQMGTQKNSLVSRFTHCDAGCLYSFCFDPAGDVYKCWNQVGDKTYRYANVRDLLEHQENIRMEQTLPFLTRSFPEDEECLNCKVLPLCMGGCIMKRVFEHQKSCSPIRYNAEAYVLGKYLKEMEGEV